MRRRRTVILHSSRDCANFVDARPKLVQALHDAAEEAAKEPSGTVVATVSAARGRARVRAPLQGAPSQAAAIGRALCAARKRPQVATLFEGGVDAAWTIDASTRGQPERPL